MTKTNKKKQSNKSNNNSNRKKTPKGARTRGAMPGPLRGNGALARAEYKRMLFDPCAADLVEPPYLGSESGYLIRTRDIINPYFVGTSLTNTTYDYFVQWSPGNLGPTSATTNFGILNGGGTAGSAMTLAAGTKYHSSAQVNFINSATTPISSYRVVACCMKFIPTGPPLDRQGMVSLVTAPSFLATSSSTPTSSEVEALCPHPVNNGAEAHEIVWLPGNKDQEYGSLEASVLEPGYASLILALSGVDSTANPAGTIATPRGRIEITTIWQWTAKSTGGIVQTLNSPPKHTVNDVLAEVVDLGRKIYTGIAKVEKGVSTVAKVLHMVS